MFISLKKKKFKQLGLKEHERTWEVGVELSRDIEEEQRREKGVTFGLRRRRRRIGEDGHVDVVEVR